MRILLLTHYYPPEIGAPQARLSEMAATWVDEGHEVAVLTAFPNHPTGVIPKEYRGQVFRSEQRDGCTIHRHWVYATPNKGFARKILGHVSLMITLVLFSLFRGRRPDMIVVSSPTFFSVFSAWLISKIRRAPYIFEVRDIWPGIFVELGVLENKFLIRTLEFFEMLLYHQARYVVPVTHGFKAIIHERGIPAEKIHVITNGVDVAFFDRPDSDPVTRAGLDIPDDAFVALYMGALGISHGLPTLIEAAAELSDDVYLLFVGEGAVRDDLMDQAAQLGLENVRFVPGQPRERVPGFYHVADTCLVPLKNIEGFKTFIPSKMFEIMACRRPIIGSLAGEAADILERSGGALVIPPEDKAALVNAIRKLRDDANLRATLAERGRSFVEEHYSRQQLARDYLEIMQGRR